MIPTKSADTDAGSDHVGIDVVFRAKLGQHSRSSVPSRMPDHLFKQGTPIDLAFSPARMKMETRGLAHRWYGRVGDTPFALSFEGDDRPGERSTPNDRRVKASVEVSSERGCDDQTYRPKRPNSQPSGAPFHLILMPTLPR